MTEATTAAGRPVPVTGGNWDRWSSEAVELTALRANEESDEQYRLLLAQPHRVIRLVSILHDYADQRDRLRSELQSLKAPPASEEIAANVKRLDSYIAGISGTNDLKVGLNMCRDAMESAAFLLLRLSSENRALRAERDNLIALLHEDMEGFASETAYDVWAMRRDEALSPTNSPQTDKGGTT